MYTLKAYRRKGIAKKLLDKVIKEAKEYRCGAIQITASNNSYNRITNKFNKQLQEKLIIAIHPNHNQQKF
jgi:GNAT superfamily N-acetyltransferase